MLSGECEKRQAGQVARWKRTRGRGEGQRDDRGPDGGGTSGPSEDFGFSLEKVKPVGALSQQGPDLTKGSQVPSLQVESRPRGWGRGRGRGKGGRRGASVRYRLERLGAGPGRGSGCIQHLHVNQ